MAFEGSIYWVNTGHEFIGKWNSFTDEILFQSVYNFPDMATGPFLFEMGIVGPLGRFADGRIAAGLGSQLTEAMVVMGADLQSPGYLTADPPSARNASPYDVHVVSDPITGGVYLPGIRNYDSFTTSHDSWTHFAPDGTPTYFAHYDGSWDFNGQGAFDEVYSGGGSALVGRTLYRGTNNGWIDRYDLDTEAWELALMYATPGSSRRLSVAGSLSDGTVVWIVQGDAFEGMSLCTLDDSSSWAPIDSSNAVLGALTGLADLTPVQEWSLEETGRSFPAGQFGDSQGVAIVDDVAYYFRQVDGDTSPYDTELIEHDLTDNTKTVLLTTHNLYLRQDGTITTEDDPDWWDSVYYPGFALVVVPEAAPEIVGQIDTSRVRPYYS